MTGEEAKSILGDVRAYLASRAALENELLAGHSYIEICNAIKALEQEPCKDAISRDMALEKMADYVSSGFADSVEDFEEYSKIICQLPSVQPKTDSIKALGEEMRKARGGIKDKKALVGFNMAVAICNKYLGESEE